MPPSVSLSHLSRVNNESSTSLSWHNSFNTSVSHPSDTGHVRSIETDEAILNPLNEMTEFVAMQRYDCDVLLANRESGMCRSAKIGSFTSVNNSDSSSNCNISSNDISKSDMDKHTA